MIGFEFALDQRIVQVRPGEQIVFDGRNQIGDAHTRAPLVTPGSLHVSREQYDIFHLFQHRKDTQYVSVLNGGLQARFFTGIQVYQRTFAVLVDTLNLGCLRIRRGQ